jgi:hypothetical protein
MKPEAPTEIRGEFQPIRTGIPALSAHCPRRNDCIARVGAVNSDGGLSWARERFGTTYSAITMTPRDLSNELIRTRADIDQTRACLDEINGRLDTLGAQIHRLIEALDARRRRDGRWQIIHLVTNSLVFAMGLALLLLTINR